MLTVNLQDYRKIKDVRIAAYKRNNVIDIAQKRKIQLMCTNSMILDCRLVKTPKLTHSEQTI